MAEQGAISLASAMVDGGANQLKGQSAAAIFLPNRQTFDLCKIAKKACANAASCVAINFAQPMGGAEIIAIELF